MQWQLERGLILAGFIASAVILSLVGWESYRDTVRVAEAAAARKHSFEVQPMLDETAIRLVDAETGQRGYLLTGDEAYLEPYHGAIRNLARVTGRLKDLTSDIHAHAESLFRKQNAWREPLIKQLEGVVTSPSLEGA
jgi:CHASE3 domain sensor protein